jgi:hypothetical protein
VELTSGACAQDALFGIFQESMMVVVEAQCLVFSSSVLLVWWCFDTFLKNGRMTPASASKRCTWPSLLTYSTKDWQGAYIIFFQSLHTTPTNLTMGEDHVNRASIQHLRRRHTPTASARHLCRTKVIRNCRHLRSSGVQGAPLPLCHKGFAQRWC